MSTMFLTVRLFAVFAVALGVVLAGDPTTSVRGRLRLPDDAPLNTTRVTLNDGQYSTYTHPDGSFAFHGVGPGVHVLDAHSHHHHFSTVKIQLLPEAMDGPKCIEYAYPGAQKLAVTHPLLLTARAQYVYFENRPGFSVFSILRNPMLLMMLVSAGLMMCMPKMMEGLDDDQKEQMKKQMEMQQDPSKMLTQLWGDISGTEEESAVAQRKPAAKAGGKTARRSKRE